MSSAQEQLRILKVDSRGRVRIPPEKQERIFEEFERSGMSGIAFAELIGVKYRKHSPNPMFSGMGWGGREWA